MNERPSPNGSAQEALCLACGLCCNGAIFGDVKLQPGEDAHRLQEAILKAPPTQPFPRAAGARSLSRTRRWPQPCPAFDGCRCRIYADRPGHCRAFFCRLLQEVAAERLLPAAALGQIRQAKRQVGKVERLLRRLGDTEEDKALRLRFQRTSQRLEKIGLDGVAAGVYAELTLAFHELNLMLAETFYPG